MLIISVLTPCGFDRTKKLYLVQWGLGLGRQSKGGGGKVVLRLASIKKRGIQKNFDYLVLLARGLAFPGAGY
jgi:hypothetical protein